MSEGKSFEMVINRPVVSEKSYASSSKGQKAQYVFKCHPTANKVQIRQAVEKAFESQKLVVVAVNTVTMKGKERVRSRGRKRVRGHSHNWKKAIVTLAPGQKIEGFFENV